MDFELNTTDLLESNDDIEKFMEKKKNKFNILHVNIRSLKKYWDEFCLIVDIIIDKLDVIILSEINVKKLDNLDEYNLNNFNKYVRRRKEKEGGGLLMFVKENYDVEIQECETKHSEMLVGKLKVENENYVKVFAIYRPPEKSRLAFLKELSDVLKKCKDKKIILIGDININVMEDSKSKEDYLNMLLTHSLMQLIDNYTREEMRKDELIQSCIDHIAIGSKLKNVKTFIIMSKIADHYIIGASCDIKQIEVKVNKSEGGMKEIIDNKRLRTDLRNLDEINLENKTSSELYQIVKNSFEKSVVNRERIIKRKNTIIKPWISYEINIMIKERDKIFKIWKKTSQNLVDKKEKLRKEYKILRNKITFLINKQKKIHYQNLLAESKNNMKKTWKVMNNLLAIPEKKSVDEIISKNFKNIDMEIVLNNFAKTFKIQPEKITHDCNIKVMDINEECYIENSFY